MLTETEIMLKGLKVLIENFGDLDAEKFIGPQHKRTLQLYQMAKQLFE